MTESSELPFKNPPEKYSDWDTYNPPQTMLSAGVGTVKQSGRYKMDILDCLNPDCPNDGKPVSEHEAFYLFAKQSMWKRMSAARRMYVCPYCGGNDLEPVGLALKY